MAPLALLALEHAPQSCWLCECKRRSHRLIATKPGNQLYRDRQATLLQVGAPLFGQCCEQHLNTWLKCGNSVRWAVHRGAKIADPDKAQSSQAMC